MVTGLGNYGDIKQETKDRQNEIHIMYNILFNPQNVLQQLK